VNCPISIGSGSGLSLTSASAGGIRAGAVTGAGPLTVSVASGTITLSTIDTTGAVTLSATGTNSPTIGDVGGTASRPSTFTFTGGATFDFAVPSTFQLNAATGTLVVDGASTVNPDTALTVHTIDVRNGGVLAPDNDIALSATVCSNTAAAGTLTVAYVDSSAAVASHSFV
jgi:hypothetical protein